MTLLSINSVSYMQLKDLMRICNENPDLFILYLNIVGFVLMTIFGTNLSLN